MAKKIVNKKTLRYYRISRVYKEKELVFYSKETVRASISAWFKNVDGVMKKLDSGKTITTPYAYYITKLYETKHPTV